MNQLLLPSAAPGTDLRLTPGAFLFNTREYRKAASLLRKD